MLRQQLLRVMVMGSALASPVLAGAEVYKWIGPDGITHYSESAPGPQSPVVETLEFADVASPAGVPPDYRAALEVAKDLEAGRLERERLRLERRRLWQEQAQAAAREQRQYPESTRYYPVYPYYHRYLRKQPRPPMNPRHRPVPSPYEHPRGHYGPRGGVQARVPGMTSR
jgi:hypothetical protein